MHEKTSQALNSETELYYQFENQILEFKQLVGFKLIQKLIDENALALTLEEKTDIVLSLIPAIDDLVLLVDPDVSSFIEKTAHCIQKHMKSSNTHFDHRKVTSCLEAVLIKPQLRKDMFESFQKDINEICFFYISKGQLKATKSDITVLAEA
jgi:hypothetical protein